MNGEEKVYNSEAGEEEENGGNVCRGRESDLMKMRGFHGREDNRCERVEAERERYDDGRKRHGHAYGQPFPSDLPQKNQFQSQRG